MGRADIDVGFGGHARMADGMGALEVSETVLGGNTVGIAKILDELEGVTQRQNLRTFHVLDVVCQPFQIAFEAEYIAMSVLGDLLLRFDPGAHLHHTIIDRGFALLHLMNDVEALPDVFLLGHLETHDVVFRHRLAVESEAGGIGTAMFQRLKHRGQFLTDIRALAPVDQSGYSAHGFLPPEKARASSRYTY